MLNGTREIQALVARGSSDYLFIYILYRFVQFYLLIYLSDGLFLYLILFALIFGHSLMLILNVFTVALSSFDALSHILFALYSFLCFAAYFIFWVFTSARLQVVSLEN